MLFVSRRGFLTRKGDSLESSRKDTNYYMDNQMF